MDSKEETNADSSRRGMAAENSDTVAKKRARRVSFAAEMTSVHFFDRDEEYNETPMVETAKIGDGSPAELCFGQLSERGKELGGEDDGDDNIDDEEMEMRRLFLRPVGSPSPGGSTFGSASSNDEDNFFGPVSANFIRPGRLSDSAASDYSDDNHDMTMDSTAFSMHYRSLAMSESGTDLKTPTGGQLFFEEKTPTNSNKGSPMVFTLGKKPIPESSFPATEVSVNDSSNDMSLVWENPNKYDYEKLSPRLDALLAESQKNLLTVSDDITSVSPKKNADQVSSSVDNGNDLVNLSDSVGKGTVWIDSNNVMNEGQSDTRIEFGDANGSYGNVLGGSSPKSFSTSALGAPASDKENCKPNSSPYQLSKNQSVSLLVACSSSPVIRKQMLLTTASPSKPWGVTSPLQDKHSSLLKNGSIEHQETETSIQKSISKLELLEKDALFSAFSSKVDNSTIKSLDFLKSPNVMEESIYEEKLAGIRWSTERNAAFEIDHAKVENRLEKSLNQAMNEQSPNKSSAKNISSGKSKSGLTEVSPSKITRSGNTLKRSLFTSKVNDDSLMTETESLLDEIASGVGGKASTPKFGSSPDRVLYKNLPASPGLQSSLSMDLQSRFKQIADFDKGQDSNPGRPGHANLSSATQNMGVVSKGMNEAMNSQFVDVYRLNLFDISATDNSETDIYNGKERIYTTANFSTPATEKQVEVMHLNAGEPISREISNLEDNISGEESRMISDKPISLSACMNLDKQRLQYPAVSPSGKELADKQLSRLPSPKTTPRSGGLVNFSANKRNLELLLRDPQRRMEVGRSPKLQKSGSDDPEKESFSVHSSTKPTGEEKQKLADAYSKFSEDMKILIFDSAAKLSGKMIDLLEDMLIHQQRLKVYEMLQHGVGLQSTIVHHDLHLDKIAETKSLFHQVIFKRAKLQLKNVKRERVLKRLDLLSSRMPESLSLRTYIASLPLQRCPSTVGAAGDRSLSVNLMKDDEACHDKLTTMRQDLEAVHRKISNLTRTFHACCKLKDEPGISETIAAVNKFLIEKTSCRFIRLDMQMWVVQDMASVNGQHNVILNYLDFVVQSIKIIVGPISSVRSSFEVNETNITKIFPNMDACIAFRFVFDAETAHKYVGARSLAQETQVTSLLLGFLLDVIEEVQIAQTEFQNLTDSRFFSPSVERLHLALCFFNFSSGRKVSLTFDLSCLKQGIYPSEILPQLESPIERHTCSSSENILDKVRDAFKHVRTGYTRILRLCVCVSQLVQASTS